MLAVGDGGVDSLPNARADHLALGVGEHHHVEHHLGHSVALADRADWLVHEVDVDAPLAEVLDEPGEVGERSPEPVGFVSDHHVIFTNVLTEPLVYLPGGRCATLAEVAVPVKLVVFVVVGILRADGAHLTILVLVVGGDADVDGDFYGALGHPNDTDVWYIDSALHV